MGAPDIGPSPGEPPRNAEAARAKVNLTLHVGGRLADGRHRLDSLVAFADVADELRALFWRGGPGPAPKDRPSLGLILEGPFADALARQLRAQDGPDTVTRAVELIEEACGAYDPNLVIVLQKNLPVAAGIGGGTADGAATLRLLDRLYELGLGEDGLMRLAARLGSDGPVCAANRNARLVEAGDISAERFDHWPPLAAVLANPGAPCPTGPVFQALGRPAGGHAPDPSPDLGTSYASALAALRHGRNDLEAPAIGLVPAIGETLAALAALPGADLARMSGSGATCFALFATPQQAQAAARLLAARKPRWWVRPAVLGGGGPPAPGD